MFSPDVKDEARRVGLRTAMAVDAHAGNLCVLYDGIFLESGKITLIKSHLTIHLIPRCNTTISESPLIQRIRTDINGEVLILSPFIVFQHTDGKGQHSSLVLFCQFMPVGYIKVGIFSINMQFSTFGTSYNNIKHGNTLIDSIEIKRCYIHRHCHIPVIRINVR